MSIRRLPLQRMSYLVSYNDVFFINRSRFSKEIFLTLKEVVTRRGESVIADLCTPSVRSIPNDERIIRKFFLSSTFKLWWPSGRKRNQGSVYGNWKSEFSRHPRVWVFRGSEVWVVVTPRRDTPPFYAFYWTWDCQFYMVLQAMKRCGLDIL